MDLAAETEQVFGAPPLIDKAVLSGEVDGAVNHWHFMARMRAAGLTERLLADRAIATVFVTHSMAEAERLATRIVRLTGSPAALSDVGT